MMYAHRHNNLNDSACQGSQEESVRAAASHLIVLIAPQWRLSIWMTRGRLTGFRSPNNWLEPTVEGGHPLTLPHWWLLVPGVVASSSQPFWCAAGGFATCQSKKVCSRTARDAACCALEEGLYCRSPTLRACHCPLAAQGAGSCFFHEYGRHVGGAPRSS